MKELTIIIPSSTEFIEPIMNFFYSLFTNKEIDEELASNIVTSVIESVSNAIIHGNKSDILKKVRIGVLIEGNKLSIRVEDQGEGFNIDDLPNPLEPENIFKPGGRGVFLMKNFMDKVDFEFTSNGTILKMEKIFEKNIE